MNRPGAWYEDSAFIVAMFVMLAVLAFLAVAHDLKMLAP